MEEWKPIRGFKGYEVSNQGNIRSNLRNEPKQLSFKDRGNFREVFLYKKGKKTSLKIHELVAEAFLFYSKDNHELIRHDLSSDKLEDLEIAERWY